MDFDFSAPPSDLKSEWGIIFMGEEKLNYFLPLTSGILRKLICKRIFPNLNFIFENSIMHRKEITSKTSRKKKS